MLEFLALLGYESDAVGSKYVCNYEPSETDIRNALTSIDIIHWGWQTVKGLANSQINLYPGTFKSIGH